MDLRKKHKTFIYKNYEYDFKDKDLNISFDFFIEPNIQLNPKIKIKNIERSKLDKEILENLIFNLGMIELVSYYKTTCSPKILLNAEKQIKPFGKNYT